jgi:hypothetical protein
MIDAKSFSAKGNGMTDDGPALQSAIDAAASQKQPLSIPAGTYLTTQELVISANGLQIIGDGSTSTIIKAAASITSCATLAGTFARIEGLTFDANRLATYAVRLQRLAVSLVRSCYFTRAIKDGIFLPRYNDQGGFTLNDSNHFDGCSAVSNGRIYCKPALSATYSGYCGELMSAAGTVSCTKGSTIVTGIGTAFTTMGIRNTYFGDFIRVGTGTDSQYLQIDSVDSDTQLRVGERRTPTLSLSGQEFAVAVGNGYTEALHADNNFNHLTGGLWRSNAGAAMQIGGLYGPLIDHPQIDTIGFLWHLGQLHPGRNSDLPHHDPAPVLRRDSGVALPVCVGLRDLGHPAHGARVARAALHLRDMEHGSVDRSVRDASDR